MRCPFIDPNYEIDLDEPCPVCGALGTQEMTKRQYNICNRASEVEEDDE